MQGGHLVTTRVSVCDQNQSLDHLEFGLDHLILTADRDRYLCLMILTIFHTYTCNNVFVHIRTAPVTSHLDPGRKLRHTLILGDPLFSVC